MDNTPRDWKVLMLFFLLKQKIYFFLLLIKWRGHNCESSVSLSLAVLTAPLHR